MTKGALACAEFCNSQPFRRCHPVLSDGQQLKCLINLWKILQLLTVLRFFFRLREFQANEDQHRGEILCALNNAFYQTGGPVLVSS